MSALPREPFDAEEAAAARAYHALPAGEPSPELDARILARVRIAGSTRRRPRPWFLGAGLGTAAAAVMAAGLAWQLGWLGPDGSGRAPSAQRDRASRAMQAEEVVDRIEVEYVELERPVAAPAPQAAAEKARAEVPPRQAPPPRAAAPPAPPPAAPPAPTMTPAPEPLPAIAATREVVAAEPQPFPAEASEADAAAGAAAAAPAAKRATGPAELGGLRATDARQRAATLPPWTTDDALAPAAWLERIRDRVRAGDRQGAEHSLRRFVLTHPQRAVPPELQRLLVE